MWSTKPLFLSLYIFLLFQLATAQDFTPCTVSGTNEPGVQGQQQDPYTGKPVCLPINRQPALYTGAFGDCLGNSQLDITRFSAAYYKDNMTLSFELEGNTNLTGSPIMMYITVFAYGENRFQYIWDPCGSSSQNICPLNNTRPFYSTTVIPLGADDVQNIPAIALVIPDFEGQAIMRIFSNQTQNEIACYSAAITNGATFALPAAVGTVVGLFVVVALGASFLAAAYGTDIVEMRLHYAHSMSVWVIFAVLQHVFFTGALSVNWPAVLPAFWSNFAWAAGMIHSKSMQENLAHFAGYNFGNTTFVGAAEIGSSSDGTGGGYSKNQIYSRALGSMSRAPTTLNDAIRAVESFNGHTANIVKRASSGNSTFNWFGKPVVPGLPLPGNYSGFAGTLSAEGIAASNAFMTSLIWLLILLLILAASVVGLKWMLEGLSAARWIKSNRLSFFRSHYLRYAGQMLLRTLFAAFFMIIFLATFQFTYHGAPGPTAIAAIAFALFCVGGPALFLMAFRERTRNGWMTQASDRLHVEMIKSFPPFAFTLESKRAKQTKSLFSIPWTRIEFSSDDPRRQDVHHNEDYIRKFGWLTARFRANEWWFFGVWMVYDFIRALFLGGAAGHPQTQVFALLAIEFIAFFVMIRIKPFEGNRLNVLMIWLLGLSKIVTTALSSAFDPAFNLGRILATALGIIIIVIQALLLIAMMILIVIGAVSTYISIMRNRELFYPEHWRPAKNAYFKHLAAEPKKTGRKTNVELIELQDAQLKADGKPYFRVESIRRVPKLAEKDDGDAFDFDPHGSRASLHGNASPVDMTPPPLPQGAHVRQASRTFSTHSGNLPFGARPGRAASWSSHDMIWSPMDSRPSSSHWKDPVSPIPDVPRIPDAIRQRESIGTTVSNESGYQIAPARARASTMRSVSSPTRAEHVVSTVSSASGADDASLLEIPRTRKRDSSNSESSSNLVPASSNRLRGPSPLGSAPVVAAVPASEQTIEPIKKSDHEERQGPDNSAEIGLAA